MVKKRHPAMPNSKREPSEDLAGATQDSESKRATLVRLISCLLARKWLRQRAEANDAQDKRPDSPGPSPGQN